MFSLFFFLRLFAVSLVGFGVFTSTLVHIYRAWWWQWRGVAGQFIQMSEMTITTGASLYCDEFTIVKYNVPSLELWIHCTVLSAHGWIGIFLELWIIPARWLHPVQCYTQILCHSFSFFRSSYSFFLLFLFFLCLKLHFTFNFMCVCIVCTEIQRDARVAPFDCALGVLRERDAMHRCYHIVHKSFHSISHLCVIACFLLYQLP